jgi:hypothetical protein
MAASTNFGPPPPTPWVLFPPRSLPLGLALLPRSPRHARPGGGAPPEIAIAH